MVNQFNKKYDIESFDIEKTFLGKVMDFVAEMATSEEQFVYVVLFFVTLAFFIIFICVYINFWRVFNKKYFMRCIGYFNYETIEVKDKAFLYFIIFVNNCVLCMPKELLLYIIDCHQDTSRFMILSRSMAAYRDVKWKL